MCSAGHMGANSIVEGFPGELDRWRAAQQLINSHGEEAELEAARRADKAIEQGSPEGERLWLDIMNKVHSLLAVAPPDGRIN